MVSSFLVIGSTFQKILLRLEREVTNDTQIFKLCKTIDDNKPVSDRAFFTSDAFISYKTDMGTCFKELENNPNEIPFPITGEVAQNKMIVFHVYRSIKPEHVLISCQNGNEFFDIVDIFQRII